MGGRGQATGLEIGGEELERAKGLGEVKEEDWRRGRRREGREEGRMMSKEVARGGEGGEGAWREGGKARVGSDPVERLPVKPSAASLWSARFRAR